MTETSDQTAQQIAAGGREALLIRLRPAFQRAAAAHADVLEIPPEQLEQMVQDAADRADGLQWRRALAGVASEQLGIELGEALRHPAVARAQELLGVPSYEDAFAEGYTPPTAPVPPSAPAAPPSARPEEWDEGGYGAPPAPPGMGSEAMPPGAETDLEAMPSAPGLAGEDATEVMPPAPPPPPLPGDETAEAELDRMSTGMPTPADAEPYPAAGEAETLGGPGAPYAGEHGPVDEQDLGERVAPEAEQEEFYAPEADERFADEEGIEDRELAEEEEPAPAGPPSTVHVPAVHLSGIANLAPGEAGLELRFADPGVDIARENEAILGRIAWREITAVEIAPPARLRRRRKDPEAKLVIRTERGDASFRVPGSDEETLREQLAGALTRVPAP